MGKYKLNLFTGLMDKVGDTAVSETDPVFEAWLLANTLSAETDQDLLAGQPVYMKGTGHLGLAQADASGTSTVVGLAVEDKLTGFACPYVFQNKLTLADWTAVIGAATLTIGAIYYLSASTAGMLTTTAPTAVGEYVCRVGMAISTTTLAIEIDPKILL